MCKIDNIDHNKIINEIISNNSIYSISADTLRDKIIERLSEEPYFIKQFKEAESESEAEFIGSELGDLAYQIATLIYKRLGLDSLGYLYIVKVYNIGSVASHNVCSIELLFYIFERIAQKIIAYALTVHIPY